MIIQLISLLAICKVLQIVTPILTRDKNDHPRCSVQEFNGVSSTKHDPTVGTLVCSSAASCINISAHNINITTPSGKTAKWTCTNVDKSFLWISYPWKHSSADDCRGEFDSIFDLKLLVRDYKQIAKDAITILINLSTDKEVLEYLASDKEFINTLLGKLTNPKEPNANLIAMLLANLAKWDDLKKLITLERSAPKELTSNNRAIDQLMDLFVKGADGTYNKDADYDYLSYLFADLAKHEEGRKYFLTKQEYDGVGVASTIKNVAFEINSHPSFLDEDEINILPYLLLPIMGNEEFDEEETMAMLPDLQLLPPDKERDSDPTIMQTHVETLMLLTTTREGRDIMREIKVYPIIRELHLKVDHDEMREACERLVQVLMRDEEGEEKVDAGMKTLARRSDKPSSSPKPFSSQSNGVAGSWASQDAEDPASDSDDDKIVEV
ncbi:hypothetical protein DID88_004359 [Monilinia fructigena]|uniref:Protein HGH1 homolog n=1 Tax=Monilinia fructigena TaxID=38457 RepID=A0A395IV40_9HELO|nr:hypothetical protein DID88_004359 [Monilinia fructigena]